MSNGLFVRRLGFCCLVGFTAVFSGKLLAEVQDSAATSTPSAAVPAHSDIYATVNGKQISIKEYESAFASLVRKKFYHGQIPEGKLQEARDEVRDKLIHRILLLEEADRRKIEPDEKAIDEAIAGYDRQYASSPVWQQRRESLLPGLRNQLVEQNRLNRLEQLVRQVPEPSESEVRAFYDGQPQLFTEPEKLHVSTILLAVDPSSTGDVWRATRVEAEAIYKRLEAGGSFEEAARLHSNSKYAEQGGDMGYLHRGMLPLALQEQIDSYEVGKVNPPVDTLEGVAIFRLDGRVPAKKREFAEVAQRAKELLIRERQEKAWNSLLKQLMASAEVKIHHQQVNKE